MRTLTNPAMRGTIAAGLTLALCEIVTDLPIAVWIIWALVGGLALTTTIRKEHATR